MPLPGSTLRYPVTRVLLERTRLAYVHVRNLLNDAKRDRVARVYGYVAIWLPEEFILLFLQEGELANATASQDGRYFRNVPLADALARVPSAAEYGEILFHECDDEQLACMFWSQIDHQSAQPPELAACEPSMVRGWLHAMMHDGVLEVDLEGSASYIVTRMGRAVRGYLTDPEGTDVESCFTELLESGRRTPLRRLRLFGVPGPLPVQAQPALVQAYRDLVTSTFRRLEEAGCGGAVAIAEHSRLSLAAAHPALARFSALSGRLTDPIEDKAAVTEAIGTWLGDVVGSAAPAQGLDPSQLMSELTRARRHSFQSAGLFEAVPWTVEW